MKTEYYQILQLSVLWVIAIGCNENIYIKWVCAVMAVAFGTLVFYL
jgi:hypothetical protein